ncbi:Rap1 GTPase-GDP dissociation stimulator 1 [Saguinus oedipus]|uniref:Rap1 GTPase-GDP dissociation stimulator 1 n=1 Tax=Saguinus oedipus TaxID=9490 RepID=A0ABQ9W336_SAGOE|nr:Rap1 GTPase-GDP dissociation stimulator 1 [Saguinus oedipus]
METSEKIQASGILQLFASLLTPQSSFKAKVANIIAEVAKNEIDSEKDSVKEHPYEFMRIPCVDAGLISPLVQLLNSKDQEEYRKLHDSLVINTKNLYLSNQ